MSEVCGVIFARGNAEPLPKPLCRWVEKRIKMKREKADGSIFFFPFFISCVFYSKACNLWALISFYRFRPRNVFFKKFILSLSCIATFVCWLPSTTFSYGVIYSGTPPWGVCGWLRGCCGVEVTLGSRMLPSEETEVLGKSLAPQATRPASWTATPLRTDSCRHPVCTNSWPGCLGAEDRYGEEGLGGGTE